MSIYLFHTLSLLFITCCICECVCSDVIATSDVSKSFEIFKIEEEIKDILKVNGENNSDNNDDGKITAKSFYFSLFVAADDVMVAVTGVNRKDDNDNKHVDILTKYIKTKGGDEWGNKAIKGNAGNDWKTQFAYKEENNNKKNVVKGLAAAAKGDKIYILLLNETEGASDQNCGIKLVEGTVSGGEAENSMIIKWETKDISNSFNSGDLKKYLTEMQPSNYLSASSLYLEANQHIVFIVHGKSNDKNKNKFVLVFLDETTEDKKVKLSYKGTAESNCYSFFFLWGGKLMMIPTHCGETNGKLIVNESSNMGETWTESTGLFGRMLDFFKDKNDFTTTTINGSNILLFTQQRSKTNVIDNSQKQFDVYVWFTDGNRVQSSGPIVTNDNITSSNLLHTKKELFGLYQNIKGEAPENITLTRLDVQLQNITSLVVAWKNSDDSVRELFKRITSLPSTFSATDGLVGFLSENSDGNSGNWKDAYNYVNATVNGGIKVDGGFKFSGKNNGAKWPVGKNKEDQPYNFTDPGFTLVANVTIDVAASDKDNSVLGVGYKSNEDQTKNIRLRCTTKSEWELTDSEDKSQKTLSNKLKCQLGSTYLVAIILNQSKLSAYIDGVQFGKNEKERTFEIKSANITHFYFGAETNEIESHVTVTNVLLYNQPLAEDVIKQLKINKDEISKQDIDKDTKIQDGSDVPNTQEDKETARDGTDSKKRTSDQSNDTGENNNNNNNTGDEETLSSTPKNSTVRGGVVGVLLFLLLLSFCM